MSRSHGYSSSRPVRDTSERHGATQTQQTAKTKNDSQRRIMGTNPKDPQTKGFRGTRSAPISRGRPEPTERNSALFQVKLTDFPELAGSSLEKPAHPVTTRECWGPRQPSTSPQAPQMASSWRDGRKDSSKLLEHKQIASDRKPSIPFTLTAQPLATSWANIASQPPKNPVPKEKPINKNHSQVKNAAAQDEETPGKKKRKKKKKTKGNEDVVAEPKELPIPQEPPKFENEEEFPGLTLSFNGTDRTLSTSNAKLCNEGNQRDGGLHQSNDYSKEKSPATKSQPIDTAKKAQKADKVSGKKSKAPVQLDIGNMLAVLEKKQQSQKAKQDAKPVILSVGGGLPVVQKQPLAQKKPPWQQDKIAHNPLDSTSPLVKKGKQREVPKPKKPTPLKRIILKEREERKQRRMLEERGERPKNEPNLPNETTEEECDAEATDEPCSPVEGLKDDLEMNTPIQVTREADEETDKEESSEPQIAVKEPHSENLTKIHSRKFREYCSQMLSKDVDECVITLLKELVRFQDRLYQKDPMKARMKRRIVMGLREVLKHLKLRKVKCVVISSNCERIQSKGGLDEALHTIINTCQEQGVPFVFALTRKSLGRCVNKHVPVSLVGIFNYDGAQDYYHKMIELSSEARKAYEAMMMSLEQGGQSEEQQSGDEVQVGSLTEDIKSDAGEEPESPEYMGIWKKILEKECNHAFLNFEEQLSSMHLDSECTENTANDQKS